MQGFKTVIFAILLALTSIFADPSMQAFVAEHLPWVGSSIAAILVVLRALTASSIFKKPE